MDRICRFIGTSHPVYKTGDIIEIQSGGDQRMPNQTDDEWKAYKADGLDLLKQNALKNDFNGRKFTEAEIQVRWEDAGTQTNDLMAQRQVYGKSLETYADKRKAEYPPIGDQLDALYHAGVFPADMEAQLKAVKDKYAKE